MVIVLIAVAITLKGNEWAKGCKISGKDEMGKKIPDSISCGNVKRSAIGWIASCVLARLPRKNPIHKKIKAPKTIAPNYYG